jgi:hypothetical protein
MDGWIFGWMDGRMAELPNELSCVLLDGGSNLGTDNFFVNVNFNTKSIVNFQKATL